MGRVALPFPPGCSVFLGRHGKPFDEKLPEMADIGISDLFGDLTHRQFTPFQQRGRVIEPDLPDIFGKTHPGIVLDQMPLAIMEKIRHFFQADALVIVLHIFQQKHEIRLVIFSGWIRNNQ